MRSGQPIQWPGGARCAFVVKIDVDAEYVWLQMDASSKDRPMVLSIGEYGPRRGIWRLLDVLDRYGIRASFMVPGKVAEKYPDAIRTVAEHGHEIGHHGYEHENFGLLNRAAQRQVFVQGIDALERVTGQRPVGFCTPIGDITRDTQELLLELGFLWSSSMRGDDRPYFVVLDGQPTNLVEICAHWELDDFPYFMFNYIPPFPAGQSRIASFEHVYSIWTSEFDGYYKCGLCYVLMLHPQCIGTPGRIRLLEQLFEYVRSRPGVWFATGSDVADFWRRYGRPNDGLK